MAEFVKVAQISDIPVGEGCPFEVKDRSIALFNLDGEFYAIDNTCTHRQGPLGEGALDEETVICPWHGWRFNVKTRQCEGIPEEGVEKFDVKIDGKNILVAI